MSLINSIASAVGNVVRGTVIPGFGNVVADVSRLSGTTRNLANETTGAWANVATGVTMRIDVLSADDIIRSWGATSDAKATGLLSGVDAPDIRENDVIIVRSVIEGKFPVMRWKIEQNPYIDGGRLWQLALVPYRAVQPA